MKNQTLTGSYPESQGICSEAIVRFLGSLDAKKLNPHSFMLVRHGKILCQAWWSPYQSEDKRYAYSLTKSFTSTAIGFALTENLLSVDDKVISFFPDKLPEFVSENLALMTIEHLLTMTSGHSGDTTKDILDNRNSDWVSTFLSLPVDLQPGNKFIYNSGASHVLSAIITQITNSTLKEYLTPRLFVPLGIHDLKWEDDSFGNSCGGWGLSLKSEDIAFFGLLYLQKGIWKGERVLPESWIDFASSALVRTDGPERENEPYDWKQGYGCQFWRCSGNAYRADGLLGQLCIIMPDQDAVIVFTGETNQVQEVLNSIQDYLIPEMREMPLEPNLKAYKKLVDHTSVLATDSISYKPLPNLAEKISGHFIALDSNTDGLESLVFTFDQNFCQMEFKDKTGVHSIRNGNGSWEETRTDFPGLNTNFIDFISGISNNRFNDAYAVFSWRDEDTLELIWQFKETAHSETLICSFDGHTFHMEILSSYAIPGDPFFDSERRIYSGRF